MLRTIGITLGFALCIAMILGAVWMIGGWQAAKFGLSVALICGGIVGIILVGMWAST